MSPAPMRRPPSAIAVIAEQCGRKVGEIEPDDRLAALGLDGLDRLALAVELETQLGLAFRDDTPEGWATVEDVIQSVREAAAPPLLDLRATPMGASWRADPARQLVTIDLRFPGRLAVGAALPVAGVGMSFEEKQQLAENIAFRLNLSSAGAPRPLSSRARTDQEEPR
jgi:acyl carrier protein